MNILTTYLIMIFFSFIQASAPIPEPFAPLSKPTSARLTEQTQKISWNLSQKRDFLLKVFRVYQTLKTLKPKKPIIALSLSGGGIRGIIPTYVLNELQKRVGSKIIDKFDIITATSTGSLIALGLTVPLDSENPHSPTLYNPSDILNCYIHRAQEIFQHETWSKSFERYGLLYAYEKIRQMSCSQSHLWRFLLLHHKFQQIKLALLSIHFLAKLTRTPIVKYLLHSVGSRLARYTSGLISPKYSSHGMKTFLASFLPPNIFLSHIPSRFDLAIPGFNFHERTMYFFRNQIAKHDKEHDYPIHEVIQGATAAPGYFPSAYISNAFGKKIPVIDGGVGANSPLQLAQVLAHNKLHSEKRSDKYILVSLETGEPEPAPPPLNPYRGFLGWFFYLIDTFFQAQTNYQHLCAKTAQDCVYINLNPTFPHHLGALDDWSNLHHYLKAAQDLTKTPDFEKLVKILKEK